MAALALAIIAACASFLIHSPRPKEEQLAVDASEALGQRAGQEVAQLIGNKGTVALMELDLQPGQAVSEVASLAIFGKTLKNHGVTIARSKRLAGGLSGLIMGRRISREDYSSLAESAPPVAAIVTYAGLPDLPPEELHQFQTTHPKLVVVDLFGTVGGGTLTDLVEQGTVALAFSQKTAPEVEQQPNETRTFERYYRIIGPAK